MNTMSGIFIFLLLILAVLWIIFPVIIYMIKNRMDTLIIEQRETKTALLKLCNIMEQRRQNP